MVGGRALDRAVVCAFVVTSALALASGCSSDGSGPRGDRASEGRAKVREPAAATGAPSIRSTTPPAYTEVVVETYGNLTGVVRWVGRRPPMPDTTVTRDHEICGARVPFPALRIADGDVVPDTVVHIEGITQGRGAPMDGPEGWQALVAQTMCRYSPPVQTMSVGRTFAVRNDDGTPTSVRATWSDGEAWFHWTGMTRGETRRARPERVGWVRLSCDDHPWTLGELVVFAHPYHAVSGERGEFRIEAIPPGRYTLRAWHAGWRVTGSSPSGGTTYSAPVVLTQEITVVAGQDVTADFALSDATP